MCFWKKNWGASLRAGARVNRPKTYYVANQELDHPRCHGHVLYAHSSDSDSWSYDFPFQDPPFQVIGTLLSTATWFLDHTSSDMPDIDLYFDNLNSFLPSSQLWVLYWWFVRSELVTLLPALKIRATSKPATTSLRKSFVKCH